MNTNELNHTYAFIKFFRAIKPHNPPKKKTKKKKRRAVAL